MFLYATLFKARTTQNISLNTTSFTINDASKLPTLGTGQYFVLEVRQGSNVEYMHCTNVSTNTLTVTRAQETTPNKRKFSSGALCIINIDPYGYELTGTGGGAVDSVNGYTGTVVLDADDIDDTSTMNKFVTSSDLTNLSNLSGTNTGDQTSIVGISGTKSEFDSACSDGNFIYSGDITQYTDEMAQDAVGAMVDSSLVYTDGTPLLQRAALTGDITASAGSNSTSITTPSSVTVATDDKVLIKDTSNSNAFARVSAISIRDLTPTAGVTGTGLEVRQTSPTLITPTLGVASATSINFGQSTLGSYEEGTFTPSVTFATPGTSSITHTAQSGEYTRIGHIVIFRSTTFFNLTKGTASGAFRMTGLPFISASTALTGGIVQAIHDSITFPVGLTYPCAIVVNDQSYAQIRVMGSGTPEAYLTPANFTDTTGIFVIINGYYFV